jgi:hypothetical protein
VLDPDREHPRAAERPALVVSRLQRSLSLVLARVTTRV